MTFEDRIAMLDKAVAKSEEPVEIMVIEDHSGSMGNLAKSALESFNKFVGEQKEVKGAANLTQIGFSNNVWVTQRGPIKTAQIATEYKILETTALNDAIGFGLSWLLNRKPDKAIIAIITDGMENASRLYSQADAKTLIEKAEANGWKVVYLAANQDAVAVGRSLGISGQTVSNWNANDPASYKKGLANFSVASTAYRSNQRFAMSANVNDGVKTDGT